MPIAGLIAGGLGALAGARDAQQARRENERGTRENYDITTSPTPYYEDYARDILGRGRGQSTMPWDVNIPNFGPGGAVQTQAGSLWNQASQTTPQSEQAGRYAQDLLGGQDPNAYRSGLYGQLQDRGPSPWLLGAYGRAGEGPDPFLMDALGRSQGQLDDPRITGLYGALQGYQGVGGIQDFMSQLGSSGDQWTAFADPALQQQNYGGGEAQGVIRPVGQAGEAPSFGETGLSGAVGRGLQDVIGGRFGGSRYQGALDNSVQGQPGQFLGQVNPMLQQATGTPYQGTIDQILGGGFLQGNPHLDDAINMEQRRVKEQFLRDVLPNIDANAEAYGAFRGGERAKAQAMQGLAQSLGDIGTQMRFSDYNARMGDLMNTLGLGVGDYRTGQAGARSLLQTGLGAEDTDQARQLAAIQSGLGNERGQAGEVLQALGLGSGRDLGALGEATSRYGISTGAETARGGQQAGLADAAAQRQFAGGQNARDRALQQLLGQQGLTANLLGMQQGAQQFGMGLQGSLANSLLQNQQFNLGQQGDLAQALAQQQQAQRGLQADVGRALAQDEQYGLGLQGGLASDYGADQRYAGGLANDLGQQEFERLLQAFGANLGVDQARQQGNRDLYGANLDRFNYQSQAPWQNLGREGDLLNLLLGRYGGEHREGVTHNPYTGPSTLGGAITGGLGAFSLFGGGF